MFTERECLSIFKHITSVNHELLPFLHQLKPQLLRFLHTKRELLNLLEYLILQLTGKITNRSPRIHNLLPPILSLAGNMRRRDDFDSRIYQKEREDLPVPWLRSILQRERLNLVLKNVGECDQSAISRLDGPDYLHRGLVFKTPENVFQPVALALRVIDLFCVVLI